MNQKIKLKIKELRLLDATIKKDGEIIFQGKTEEIPDELKDINYSKIYFEGVAVVIEI